MDVDSMVAGPQLDALVAERVMGQRIEWRNGRPWWVGGEELPGSPYILGDGLYGHIIHPYSSDIRWAWDVLNKFNGLGLVVATGSKRLIENRELLWYAIIGMAKPIDEFDMKSNILGEAEGPTAPLAICRAAMKAIGKARESALR